MAKKSKPTFEITLNGRPTLVTFSAQLSQDQAAELAELLRPGRPDPAVLVDLTRFAQVNRLEVKFEAR